MPMFTAYFDASGNAEQSESFVIVAGYIANSLQWREFDNIWAKIHSDYGVARPFHMSDFMAATADPDRYSRQKNARQDYVAIARDEKRAQDFFKQICISQLSMVNCGISCVVNMKIYDGISSLLDLRKVVPPYALAARTCHAQVHLWEQLFAIQEPVECVFEKGDLEQNKFTELVASEGGDPPIYKPKTDSAGLQAADHYAWEQFYYMKKSKTGAHFPARESFKFLLNFIPCIHREVTIESLIHVCQAKGIDPRTGVSHK
jgi:hypothetical protein